MENENTTTPHSPESFAAATPGADETPKTCNANPAAKYIRIILSLAVIGLGIWYRNPLGAFGLLTLYTAFTGKCGASFPLSRNSGYKIKR